jgi:hypothetical protein
MQCSQCRKEFRRATTHQRFCSDDCRYAHHNRKKKDAADDAKDEQYRREVLAHEARINGFTHIEAVALPPPQLTGPKCGLLPVAQPKNETEEEQQVA